MSFYVLDTDTLQMFEDQHPAVVACVAAVDPADLAICVVTVEEQLSGWYAVPRKAKTDEDLAWPYERLAATVRFLARLQIVNFDDQAIWRYGELRKLKLKVRKMICESRQRR